MRKMPLLLLLLVLVAIPGFAGELLVNGGFETGDLMPWFQARDFCGGLCIDWAVTDTKAHSGTFSATVTGNIELRQNFTPTAGADITSVTFWAIAGFQFGAIDFFYTDGSDEEFVYDASSTDWTLVDATADVDTGKTLSGFSVWGGDPNGVYFYDDLSITTGGTGVPEPGTMMLFGSGVVGLAGFARRKFNS